MGKEVKKYRLRKLSIGCVSCLVGAMVIFVPKASAETPEDNSGSVFRSVPNDSKNIVYVRDLSEENTTTAEDGSESNPYKDFSRALDAVSDNGTIALTGNVVWQGGSDLVIKKNITIDGRNNELAIRGTDLVLDANVTLKDISISSRRDGATNAQSIYTGNNTVVFDNVITNSIDRPNLVVGTKNSSDTDTSSNVTLRNSTVETKFEKIIVGGNRPANHSVTIDDKVSSIHGISIQNKGQNYTVTSNSTSISRVESDSNQEGTVVLNKDVPNITVTNVNALTISGDISSNIITGVNNLEITGRLKISNELIVNAISGAGTLTVPIIENAISALTISNDLTVNLDSNQSLSDKVNKTIINTVSYVKRHVLVNGYSLEQNSDVSGYILKQDQKFVYVELYEDLNLNGMLDDEEIENEDSYKGELDNVEYIDNNLNSYSSVLSLKLKEKSNLANYVLVDNAPFMLIYKDEETSDEVVGFRILINPKPEDNGKSTIKYKVLDFEGKELIGLTTIGEVDKNTRYVHNEADIAKLPENYELNNYDDASSIQNVTENEYIIVYRADLIGSETVVSDLIVSDSFTTQYTTNTDEAKGYEKVVQEGKDELTQTTTVYKTKNGERTDEEVSSESVIIQTMQPKIIEKGVKEDISKTEDLPPVYELDTTRGKDTPDETVTGTPKRISETYHWSIDDAGNYTTNKRVSSKVVEDGTNPVVKKGGKEEQYTEELEFNKRTIENSDKPEGYRHVTPGKKGLKTVITSYVIDRQTGVVTSNVREEIQPPIDEIVEVGTLKENLVPQPTPQPNPELEKATSPSTYPTVDEKPKAELGTSPSTYPTVDEKPKAELGASPSTYPTVDEKPTAELGTSPSVYPTVAEKPKAELGTSPSTYPTVDEKPTAELGTSLSVYPTMAKKPTAELGTSLSVYPTMAEKPNAELGISPSVYPTVDEKPKAELGTSPSTYPTMAEKPKAELGKIVGEQSNSEELTSSKLEKKSQGSREVHDNDVKTQDSTRSTSQSTRLPKTGDSSIGLASSMLFLTSALSLFKFGRDKAKKQGR